VIFSWGVKRQELEADHSPPTSSEVKKTSIYISTAPTRLRGVLLSELSTGRNFPLRNQVKRKTFLTLQKRSSASRVQAIKNSASVRQRHGICSWLPPVPRSKFMDIAWNWAETALRSLTPFEIRCSDLLTVSLNIVPVLSRHCSAKTHGGVDRRSALLRGEWAASRPCCVIPDTHWIRGWVGPGAGLNDVEKKKLSTLPGIELQTLCRPARSQSLHRLLYSGSRLINCKNKLFGPSPRANYTDRVAATFPSK
jgi:hypothetical protein